MPRTPRDLSGKQLCRLLKRFGYQISHQTGSHIRLISNFTGREHSITIPDHDPIKIGTLNKILNDVASYLMIPKSDLLEEPLK